MIAGFLATGLPGLTWSRLGDGTQAAWAGVGWGASITAFAVIGWGLITLLVLWRAKAKPPARIKAAISVAVAGPVGWALLLVGAVGGTWLGGRVSGGEALAAVLESWWLGGGVLAAALAMAAAIALTARDLPAD